MSSTETMICPNCDAAYLERTRFFPRQMVYPDDLTQDQEYFRNKHRRHNRLLHGWGVVCGGRVKAGHDPCTIDVEEAYLFGPYGDEIVIERQVTVDLCRESLDGDAVGACGPGLDPWCSDVRVNRPTGQPLYVAVRYAECETRPVRVPAGGCGCDLSECEYSRTRDSYVIKVLTRLPGSYSDPMLQPSFEDAIRCTDSGPRLCPPCPTEPWVILADVTLTADGHVDQIDCFKHRRYVVSFANYYFLCQQLRITNFTVGNPPATLARNAQVHVFLSGPAPAPGGTTITFTADQPQLVQFFPTLVIPAGQSQGTLEVAASPTIQEATNVVFTASLQGQTVPITVPVAPPS